MYVNVFACTYVCIYVCMSVCVCVCMYACMYSCIGCICMHASMRVFGKYVTCFTPSYLRVFRATPPVNIQITIRTHICTNVRKA